jgi:hypothetical protein
MMFFADKFKYFTVAIVMVFSFVSFMAVASDTVQAANVLKRVCDNASNKNPGKNPSVCADNAPAPGAGGDPLIGPNGIIASIINIISLIVGIVAVIMIILGGFRFVTSGSNPQEVSKAREIIIYAIVGLIVVALAQTMVRFVLQRLFA